MKYVLYAAMPMYHKNITTYKYKQQADNYAKQLNQKVNHNTSDLAFYVEEIEENKSLTEIMEEWEFDK